VKCGSVERGEGKTRRDQRRKGKNGVGKRGWRGKNKCADIMPYEGVPFSL